MAWLKGNLHTHTDLSDGDSPPGHVARWYADHGYDFLVISDHNVLVATDDMQLELDSEGRRLLLIPGEELTSWLPRGDRTHALHVNGIATSHQLGPAHGDSVVSVLQAMIDSVVADGGLPSLNHPNFWASVTWEEMAQLSQLTHFEVFNGHPRAFNFGAEKSELGPLLSMDSVWDLLLMRGRRLYGIAVDDAHHFRNWAPGLSNPGRGWVAVDTTSDGDTPTAAAIVEGLRAGRFYASTGPSLAEISQVGAEIGVMATGSGDFEVIVNGVVTERRIGQRVDVELPADGYVRVRFSDSTGTAWTQPWFT